MANLISEEGLKNSVPVEKMATAEICLSNGTTLEVTNPATKIAALFQFVENPKNRFLIIGGVMVNISQIAAMRWINETAYKVRGRE